MLSTLIVPTLDNIGYSCKDNPLEDALYFVGLEGNTYNIELPQTTHSRQTIFRLTFRLEFDLPQR